MRRTFGCKKMNIPHKEGIAPCQPQQARLMGTKETAGSF
jgi:hypothetical protein